MDSISNYSILMAKVDADELIKGRKFQEAEKLYTSWLERNLSVKELDKASLALAYNNRGHAKYLSVDFDGALGDYNEGLKYDPNLPALYSNRGTIMYRMGYFDKAAEDMAIAVRLEPSCEEFKVAYQKAVAQLQVNQNSECEK